MLKSKCYQLIGIPGSGKTTWAENQKWTTSVKVVSTDKWIELFSLQLNKSYSEIFDNMMPIAVDLMVKEINYARSDKKDIIWDQTSTTIKSRYRKFNLLPDYDHIAVVFKIPDRKELLRRLNNRPGKIIPTEVIDKMIKEFQEPTLEEGFTEIWRV